MNKELFTDFKTKIKGKTMLLTSFINGNEIPAYAGMTQLVGREKSGAACRRVRTFVGMTLPRRFFLLNKDIRHSGVSRKLAD